MAQPVLAELRARPDPPQTALTWFSPSAEGFARTFAADFRDYLPFDTARGATRALDALQPTALVFAKLDVWPVLAEHASRRDVGLALIAASLGPASARRGALARAVLRDAYARLDAVGAATDDDAEGLVALGVRPGCIVVPGDTRFDQAWGRARRVDLNSPLLTRLGSSRPTVVAGSTWHPDESALLHAWREVRRACSDARLIVAPHEPSASHVAALQNRFSTEGLSVVLESAGRPENADVVIIDRVGVLAEVYACGQIAYVGGGFHDFGIHSVIEPAALGVPVVIGPAWRTSRDAVALVNAGGGRTAQSGAELAGLLVDLLRDAAATASSGVAARAFVERGLGATARSLELVEHLLGRGAPQDRAGGL